MRLAALALVACAFTSSAALGGERCFELAADERFAGQTTSMCIVEAAMPRATVTLSERGATVARFELELYSRVRCPDCNRDVFGPPSPSGLDILQVRFDGTSSRGVESGSVTIGAKRFAYRSQAPGAAPPAGPPPPAAAAAPPPPPQGMAPEPFARLLQVLEANQWSVTGIETAVASAAKANRFTCEQVATVLKKVPGQALKDSAAKQLVPRVVDPDNLALVSAVILDDATKYRPRPTPK